ANRSDHGDAFANVDSFGQLENQIEDAGVDDRDIRFGARRRRNRRGRRAVRRPGREFPDPEGNGSEALRTLDAPTEDEVVEYAAERDVPAEYVTTSLEKLAQRGRVSESRGVYRLMQTLERTRASSWAGTTSRTEPFREPRLQTPV
ncbi:DUF5817 family protein, partial [Natronoarchaeum sp. GCM10025703]|uniref:DUF5817 family protein n=1 Tax=Natronoarchaeum sp. GCM10025703 TaxID=3252685 RepID=UPI0036234FDE